MYIMLNILQDVRAPVIGTGHIDAKWKKCLHDDNAILMADS